MATSPIITFKAGRCELSNKKVKPDPTPGYVYLYSEDDLLHFCWRTRGTPSTDPTLDLVMIPGDGTFTPYLRKNSTNGEKHSPINGRIFMLKFSSSSERHYFWLQSKSQHQDGTASWFSHRDEQLGEIINNLLQGEELDIQSEVASMRQNGRRDDDDEDEAMDDAGPDDNELTRRASGGAGPDATGGDPREEGEDSRRGGADGGRAASDDPSAIVQNFLRSLQGSNAVPQGQSHDRPFTSLPELLNTDQTIPFLRSATSSQIDALCLHLPASLFLLSQESGSSFSSAEPSPDATQAAVEALSTDQKRDILERVLRSPQLHQSLGSLNVALRDGGLPMIADALGIEVENGGHIRNGTMPLGGGEAVEKFVAGVKKGVEKEKRQ